MCNDTVGRMSSRFLPYIVVALMYMALAMHLPVSIHTGAGHDDSWFVTNAENIFKGYWFGRYSQMTLIKGPAFCFFLVGNYLLGLPVTLSFAVLYLFACTILVATLKRAGLHGFLAFSLFALLLFQPALFPTRIIRDNIYHSLTLLTLSGVAYCAMERAAGRLYVATFGVCGGLFWITREEGIWLVPSVMLILGYGIIIRRANRQSELSSYIKLVLFFMAWALLPITTTALVNKLKYGIFQVVDVKSTSFVNALDALNSVAVGDEVPFAPVPERKRGAIYAVSPAFKELEGYFEGSGRKWTEPGCRIYPHTCGDFAGGWFMWALRDGVSALGYYSSPGKASEYYNRLAKEVNSACETGKLSCSVRLVPYLPRLSADVLPAFAEKVVKAVQFTLYRFDVPLDAGNSWPPLSRLREMREFLGNPRITAAQGEGYFVVSGWYYRQGDEWLRLICDADGLRSVVEVARQSSVDIAEHFRDPNASSRRFSFRVAESAKCAIDFDGADRTPIHLAKVVDDPPAFLLGGVFHLDEIKLAFLNKPVKDWTVLKGYLSRFYKSVSATIFAAGLVALVVTTAILCLGKTRLNMLFVISVGFWFSYACRVGLVVMVDVSSFPAIDFLYLMPAFPIMFAAAFTSFSSLFAAVRQSDGSYNSV